MPKGKFKPDPSSYQSGYYNDRMGTPDVSQGKVTGDSLSAATQETSHTVQTIAKQLQKSGAIPGAPTTSIATGAVPGPDQLMSMLKGGGAEPERDRMSMVQIAGGWYVSPDDPRAQVSKSTFADPAKNKVFFDPSSGEVLTNDVMLGVPEVQKSAKPIPEKVDKEDKKLQEEDLSDDDAPESTEDDSVEKSANWAYDFNGTPFLSRALKIEISRVMSNRELAKARFTSAEPSFIVQKAGQIESEFRDQKMGLHLDYLKWELAKDSLNQRRLAKSKKMPVPENLKELIELTGAQVICLSMIGVETVGIDADYVQKGAGHKYIKRVPKPGGGYRYFYNVARVHSGGTNFTEGSSHSIEHDGKKGHFHIQKIDGDMLHLKHDESGHSLKMTKKEFAALRAKAHSKALRAKQKGHEAKSGKGKGAAGKANERASEGAKNARREAILTRLAHRKDKQGKKASPQTEIQKLANSVAKDLDLPGLDIHVISEQSVSFPIDQAKALRKKILAAKVKLPVMNLGPEGDKAQMSKKGLMTALKALANKQAPSATNKTQKKGKSKKSASDKSQGSKAAMKALATKLQAAIKKESDAHKGMMMGKVSSSLMNAKSIATRLQSGKANGGDVKEAERLLSEGILPKAKVQKPLEGKKAHELTPSAYLTQQGIHEPHIAEISPFQYAKLGKQQKAAYDKKRQAEWQASIDGKEEWRKKVLAAHAAGEIKAPYANKDVKNAILQSKIKADKEAKAAAEEKASASNELSMSELKVGQKVYHFGYKYGEVVKVNKKSAIVQFGGSKLKVYEGSLAKKSPQDLKEGLTKSSSTKENQMKELNDYIQKSQAALADSTETVINDDAKNILDSFLQKSGQGGMPVACEPRKDLPRDRRPEDGGNMPGPSGGPSDAGMATAESTAKKKKQKGANYQDGMTSAPCASEDLQSKTPADKTIQKSVDKVIREIDWSKPTEAASRLNSLAKSIQNQGDGDIVMGGYTGAEDSGHSSVVDEVTMVRKGFVFEADRDDQRVMKAMNTYGDGGLFFTQGGDVNLAAPLHKSVKCGKCSTKTKAMYASCQSCGASIKKSEVTSQGVRMDDDVQKSLVFGEEPDLVFGV